MKHSTKKVKKTMATRANTGRTIVAFVLNFGLIYIAYMLCRIVFIFENWNLYHNSLFDNNLYDLLSGSLRFDTSAIMYTNALYALLMLIPLHYKEHRVWQGVTKSIFVIVNAIAITMNLVDSVYFQFTGRRTTISVFKEFENENNLTDVLSTACQQHWYLVLIGLLMIAALWFFYVSPDGKLKLKGNYLKYYCLHLVALLMFVPLCIAGMRGGFTGATRPIALNDANMYVSAPHEAVAVLNTPFAFLRTINKDYKERHYFNNEELDNIYSPIHQPNTTAQGSMKKKNVVVLILESFGREYIGAYNKHLDGGEYKGYTPFLDKLYAESTTFENSFSNGRKSIDGMPSILSSLPMMVVPFFISQRSLNEVSGLAGELGKVGYNSAFFHGAQNSSMGFSSFARATGYESYFGRTEFDEDKRFGGEKDFDGTWAIWDEPFLQFYALKMSEMKEPFITSVFTASSHHPFAVPEQYKDIYTDDGDNVIHKCIRYSDHALERFFETAKKQPWFENTIFILTCDHTNIADHPEYKTSLGVFCAPLLFYDPSHSIFKAECRSGIAQQIDIMPTILNALGYDKPYVAFGKDLLNTPAEDTWAVSYEGLFQYVKGVYFLQFDGERVIGLYNFKKDVLLKNNLAGTGLNEEEDLKKNLQALIQSYMHRMINNELVIR